jgi:hypothetical protein
MTKTFVVCHVIRQQGDEPKTGIDLYPNLRIEEVPDKMTRRDVQEALESAGLTPMENGMPWANYGLFDWDQGTPTPLAETYTWQAILGRPQEYQRLPVRLTKADAERIRHLSFRKQVSMSEICSEFIHQALEAQKG